MTEEERIKRLTRNNFFDNLSIEEFDKLLEENGIDDVPSKESDLLNQVYKSFEKEVGDD